MTFYHLLFGEDGPARRGPVLLGMLGFGTFAEVGRYRDAWVEKGDNGQPIIAVYTRNGAGNRNCIATIIEEPCEGNCTGCIATSKLPAHPHYLRDQDDAFDSTYATFYFATPPQFVEVLTEHAVEPVDTSKRWRDAIAAIGGEEL